MKTCVAAFALFSVVACGGTTTPVPSAGGDAGTTTDAGTNPSPVPTPAPACTDCLATTVSWGQNGGLVAFTDASSLKACRTYDRSRVMGNGAPTPLCTATLDACGAAPIAVGDVEAALANPDVTAALAGNTKTYGSDSRPCDGSVLSITVGAKTVEVGGECTGTTGGCSSTPCVAVPAGLRALADLLEKLDAQEANAKPACAGH